MIEALLRSKKTVFRTQEIANLIGIPVDKRLRERVQYYVRIGKLIRLSKGLYALDQDYDVLELGNALRRPSYISLYTVLQQAGVVFQSYRPVYLVANRSEQVTIGPNTFIYRQVKPAILSNPLGLELKDRITVASTERAIADKVYLDGDEYFDNLRSIDWGKMAQLNQQVYQSDSLTSFIEKYHA